jgi:hypothetical protein
MSCGDFNMATSAETRMAFLPCQACQLRPALLPDIFCDSCRTIIRTRDAGPAKLAPPVRFVRALFSEAIYGLFLASLIIPTISSASSGSIRLLPFLGLAILPAVFTLPLIATLRAYAVRPYIRRAGHWGWLSTAHAGIMTLLMGLAVGWGGLRYASVPKIVLFCAVALVTWLLGVGVARVQEAYLPAPQQRRARWRAWALGGWTIGCVVQVVIGLLITHYDLALLLSIAAGAMVYHIHATVLLKRFAREAVLIKDLQKEYSLIWYNQ